MAANPAMVFASNPEDFAAILIVSKWDEGRTFEQSLGTVDAFFTIFVVVSVGCQFPETNESARIASIVFAGLAALAAVITSLMRLLRKFGVGTYQIGRDLLEAHTFQSILSIAVRQTSVNRNCSTINEKERTFTLVESLVLVAFAFGDESNKRCIRAINTVLVEHGLHQLPEIHDHYNVWNHVKSQIRL